MESLTKDAPVKIFNPIYRNRLSYRKTEREREREEGFGQALSLSLQRSLLRRSRYAHGLEIPHTIVTLVAIVTLLYTCLYVSLV